MAAMLTTIDNPYSPFDNFREWYAFDMSMGYNSCSYLDRVCNTSNELSDEFNEMSIEEAIDEIVRINVNGKYKKVFESDYKAS